MALSQVNVDTILESQFQLQSLFLQRMEEMESELKKATSPTSSLSTTTLAEDYFKFKDFVLSAFRAIQAQISSMSKNLDNLEMHKRRQILLLHGVPEGKGEDTAALVAEIVVDRLKIPDFSVTDIRRCHRMGRPTAQARPRPILVKLCVFEMRNKIWYAKTKLRGSGITLSEFLTKTRHDIFMAARQKLGVTNCWTREGYVFVLGSDGTRHRVNSMEEIDGLATPASGAHKQSKVQKEVVAPSTKSRRNVASSKK